MVIEMNTYKIYKLNPNVVGLLEQYPEVKNQIINIEPKNVFFTKQMECLFVIIEANKKTNIFLDILYQISKSYVIMVEQSKNLEV